MKPLRSFASDNNAGVHPEVLKAISAANQGHVVGYGDDPYTSSAVEEFKRHFGDDIEVFFVFNGTAANCLALKALTNSYHAVICAEAAHIYVDECGAPEKFTGCKLIPIPTNDGRLTVPAVRAAYHGIGDEHHVQPRVISITQATEVGTVYKPNEIQELSAFAHDHGMFLHADGARIANAAASLGLTLRQSTRDLGIDVLSFGATKNGAMGAEAVVFFPNFPSPYYSKSPGTSSSDCHSEASSETIKPGTCFSADFKFYRKQAMQLSSKMRFISVQFEAMFQDDLWLRNARHSNRMAQLLKREVRQISQVRLVYKVEANGVFAQIPRRTIAKLQKRYFFYVWNEERSIVRWMCSWDTTESDIKQFAQLLRQLT